MKACYDCVLSFSPLKPSELICAMQLVGIGFARSHWNSLVKRLQKQVSHQLNSTLFSESLSDSVARIRSKESPNAAEGIVKLKPDWILFSSAAFETPETCIKLLQEVQK